MKMNLSKGNLFNFEYLSFKTKNNSIFVSMAAMEATMVLALFQLILEGY